MRRDVTPILRNLFIGSAPAPGYWGDDFDMIYLVAEEVDIPDEALRGVEVRRYPFDDSRFPTAADIRTAMDAAESVARNVRRGRRVLVTCAMGRNRSALVVGLAVHFLTGEDGCRIAREISRRRVDRHGVPALSNPAFRQILCDV